MTKTGTKRYLAVDLGAASGRVMLARLESDRVEVAEVHRFANEPVRMRGTLFWDFPRLLLEVERGLAAGAREAEGPIDGIGVDSWGVDFGLLDSSGQLVANPVHYRDARTERVADDVFAAVPRSEIYEQTGIQHLSLNTIFQLAAVGRDTPRWLEAAERLLLIADLVAYFLCGRAAAEETNASTTQLWNPRERCWARPLIVRLGLPARMFPEVVPPGSFLAPLSPDVALRCGLDPDPAVIATASHDTASAIAAIPAAGDDWAYLSSGTWSLLGVELDTPLIRAEGERANFTNETGAGGKTTFLRNITGLWLLQECRRSWNEAGKEYSDAKLVELAEAAPGGGSLVVPDAPELFAPADMPAAIRAFCQRTGQPPPRTDGALVRCVLESLALTYRQVLDEAVRLSGRAVKRLHIVGGGSRNAVLNQLAADATGREVVAGPAEATALGNVLVQALGAGALPSLEAARSVARRSTETSSFSPQARDAWEERFARFQALAARA